MVRRALQHWFDAEDIRPRVVAELGDSALAKEFGEDGMGVFAPPAVIEAEILRRYQVRVVGRSEAVRQHFYAISVASRATAAAQASSPFLRRLRGARAGWLAPAGWRGTLPSWCRGGR